MLFLSFVLVKAAFNMHSKSKAAENYFLSTKKEYENLEYQYENVSKDLDFFKSDTGQEKEIRSRFDLGREGEKAILIIEENLPPTQEPVKKSFWKKVKDWASF